MELSSSLVLASRGCHCHMAHVSIISGRVLLAGSGALQGLTSWVRGLAGSY